MTPAELRLVLLQVLPANAAEALALTISRFRVRGVRVEFTPKDHPTHPGMRTLDDRARDDWKQASKSLRTAASALAAIQPDDPLVATLRERARALDIEAAARRRRAGNRHDVKTLALVVRVATVCAAHGVAFTDTDNGPAARIVAYAFEFHGRDRATKSLRPYLRLGRDVQAQLRLTIPPENK